MAGSGARRDAGFVANEMAVPGSRALQIAFVGTVDPAVPGAGAHAAAAPTLEIPMRRRGLIVAARDERGDQQRRTDAKELPGQTSAPLMLSHLSTIR
jgi:hypothetical protein